ncbi:hypothetical protein HI914_06343 [Erysiphe necator]|nr:hypothetical protein HI914_06343 [Erysiphe necator]
MNYICQANINSEPQNSPALNISLSWLLIVEALRNGKLLTLIHWPFGAKIKDQTGCSINFAEERKLQNAILAQALEKVACSY